MSPLCPGLVARCDVTLFSKGTSQSVLPVRPVSGTNPDDSQTRSIQERVYIVVRRGWRAQLLTCVVCVIRVDVSVNDPYTMAWGWETPRTVVTSGRKRQKPSCTYGRHWKARVRRNQRGNRIVFRTGKSLRADWKSGNFYIMEAGVFGRLASIEFALYLPGRSWPVVIFDVRGVCNTP